MNKINLLAITHHSRLNINPIYPEVPQRLDTQKKPKRCHWIG
jgi:hypothetical protein